MLCSGWARSERLAGGAGGRFTPLVVVVAGTSSVGFWLRRHTRPGLFLPFFLFFLRSLFCCVALEGAAVGAG